MSAVTAANPRSEATAQPQGKAGQPFNTTPRSSSRPTAAAGGLLCWECPAAGGKTICTPRALSSAGRRPHPHRWLCAWRADRPDPAAVCPLDAGTGPDRAQPCPRLCRCVPPPPPRHRDKTANTLGAGWCRTRAMARRRRAHLPRAPGSVAPASGHRDQGPSSRAAHPAATFRPDWFPDVPPCIHPQESAQNLSHRPHFTSRVPYAVACARVLPAPRPLGHSRPRTWPPPAALPRAGLGPVSQGPLHPTRRQTSTWT